MNKCEIRGYDGHYNVVFSGKFDFMDEASNYFYSMDMTAKDIEGLFCFCLYNQRDEHVSTLYPRGNIC